MNIFEQAARRKYRFPSAKGELTVEDLFDVPLTSRNGFDLDMIARGINTSLKSATEESFVAVNRNPGRADLDAKLEIVKHVIASKMEEAAKASQRAERAEKRRQILDALARKDAEEINSASREELLRQLEAISE